MKFYNFNLSVSQLYFVHCLLLFITLHIWKKIGKIEFVCLPQGCIPNPEFDSKNGIQTSKQKFCFFAENFRTDLMTLNHVFLLLGKAIDGSNKATYNQSVWATGLLVICQFYYVMNLAILGQKFQMQQKRQESHLVRQLFALCL